MALPIKKLYDILTQAGWQMVRPLSNSIFRLTSAGKSPIGDCFKFNAIIQAPRNTTRLNKYATWTIRK
jgi:hypothetical protein